MTATCREKLRKSQMLHPAIVASPPCDNRPINQGKNSAATSVFTVKTIPHSSAPVTNSPEASVASARSHSTTA